MNTCYSREARRGGLEVVGRTVDRNTRVRFPAYPQHVLALWCKEVKDVFRCPGARVGVGSARWIPLAAHGVGCPAAGQIWKTGQLSCHYTAEISLNVRLSHNQRIIAEKIHYQKKNTSWSV